MAIVIGMRQPAERNAFEVEGLEEPRAFGLVGGEFPVPAAYQLGLEEAGFHPTSSSREVSPEDSQSSCEVTAANESYNARFRG
jgi:hypothetical protein